jgi:multisubunit Na+/H+ antiporter MnhB subunit
LEACAYIATALAFRMHPKQIKERIGVFIVVSVGIEVLVIAPRLE